MTRSVDGKLSDIGDSDIDMNSNKGKEDDEISLFGIDDVVNPDKVKRGGGDTTTKKEPINVFKKPIEDEDEKDTEGEVADDEADGESVPEKDVDEVSHKATSSAGENEDNAETKSVSSTQSRRSANYQEYNFFRGRSSQVPNNEDDFKKKTELLSEWEDLVRRTNERQARQLNLNSSADEIKYEIEKIKYRRKKQNAIKMMGRGTYLLSKLFEWISGKIEFFEIDLDGWSTSVKHNLSDYDEVFEELYEKYKGATSGAPPELKFLMLFTMSAVQFAIINQAPRMISKFMNNTGGNEGPSSGRKRRPATPTQYRKMTPPSLDDLEDDPELEELLYDIEKNKQTRRA